MKKLAKLIAISVSGLAVVFVFLSSASLSMSESALSAELAVNPSTTPTPPANPMATATANATSAVDSPKPSPATIVNTVFPKTFILAKDSQSDEYGEVNFDHEGHAFANRSPDGKSVIGCAVCHHTEQPKPSLKPPLMTSERDKILTFELWKTSPQKVSECRSCHFQEKKVPKGKKMPSIMIMKSGKSSPKDIDNYVAFHTNCINCHTDAARLRPELKTKNGLTNDCTTCHANKDE